MALCISLVNVAWERLISQQGLSVSKPVTRSTPYGSIQVTNRATARLATAVQNYLIHLQPRFAAITTGESIGAENDRLQQPAPCSPYKIYSEIESHCDNKN